MCGFYLHCNQGSEITAGGEKKNPLKVNLDPYSACCTDLVDSADLTLDTVVLWPSTTRSVVSRHVQTHHMLAFGEILVEKTKLV